ncbi:MAG: hypothetical protein JWM34_600 [Ilumatobacteraceae bacterium]|nr:hypothetical protein [Ilumatobacteraceae bacterium]
MKVVDIPKDVRAERACLQALKIVAIAFAAIGLIITYFGTGDAWTKLLLIPVGFVGWLAITNVYEFANHEIERIEVKYGLVPWAVKQVKKKPDPPPVDNLPGKGS